MSEDKTTIEESENGTRLVDAKGLLNALFDDDCRPSLRWVRQMQSTRRISYIKIGHLVRFDIGEVRKELSSKYKVSSR